MWNLYEPEPQLALRKCSKSLPSTHLSKKQLCVKPNIGFTSQVGLPTFLETPISWPLDLVSFVANTKFPPVQSSSSHLLSICSRPGFVLVSHNSV